MASFLGPETPRPFSVISESYQGKLHIPSLSTQDRYSFGEAYEDKLCHLIHRYLELGTSDRLCYVGEEKGNLCPVLERHFCLMEPVTSIVPGHMHYEQTSNGKAVISVPISNVGAEEYFTKQAKDAQYTGLNRMYDKVILKDAINFLEHPKQAYKNIMETVSEYGRILIIQRPWPMNTLPCPPATRKKSEGDQNYMNIILDLQASGFDVQWDIETVPIMMPKVKWYAMLKEKFPSPMQSTSDFEVACGIRELSEGMLKYEGEIIEFSDRLLFVTACRSLMQTGCPSIQRHDGKGNTMFQASEELKYKLKVTPEMSKYIEKNRWK